LYDGALAEKEMKKRLRKKKRLGEFREFGFEVRFELATGLDTDERDVLIDAFIFEAIEANGLQFGGGGTDAWSGFVMLDRDRGSATEDHRQVVKAWLEQQSDITNVRVGELRDGWYGWDDE
jgi:uncharacterized protein